ncbi:MAG: methyltransferase [Hyphomicrobiaceae bacterium]
MTVDLAAFAISLTCEQNAALVPEIRLRLADDAQAVFTAARRFEEQHPGLSVYPPYWAFAWPGGQAMARYILDNPEIVRGLRVADIGAGSGIAAIAAAKAGATSVLAVDIDPVAAAVIAMNAATNDLGSLITPSTVDCLATVPTVDVILISDLVYEPELAIRVVGFIERAVATGLPVIVGDRLSARRPARGFEEVVRYDAPLTPALHDEDAKVGRVWRSSLARREPRASGRAMVDR